MHCTADTIFSPLAASILKLLTRDSLHLRGNHTQSVTDAKYKRVERARKEKDLPEIIGARDLPVLNEMPEF